MSKTSRVTCAAVTVRTMSDLIDENAIGVVQDASISVGHSLSELEAAMSTLGIDRRTAMPDDEDSLEYRLRAAHAKLKSAENELREEAGYD